MYYVYRFLDKSKNVIYVGKSKLDLEIRFAGHLHLPNECYAMVHKIEYITCSTESDMSIKEIYYINKHKKDKQYFFNVLDTTELPQSVKFDDKWKMYRGPLPAHFSRSINFKKGYTTQKEVRYNKDGSIDKRKVNKEKGVSDYVEGFDSKEVDLITNYLIKEIISAENNNQEQIRFRNLVMFVLGVNLPLKPSDFLSLRYCDLFDKKDRPKEYELNLGRHQHDEIICIPLHSNVKELLKLYRKVFNLSFVNDSEKSLFLSREHQTLKLASWGHILSVASEAVNIKKNIGAESLRKTYGLNIYKNSRNKMKALLFLGELWGQVREAKIIKYLGLVDNKIDFDYYFGESFALGNVDLTKLMHLRSKEVSLKNKAPMDAPVITNKRKAQSQKTKKVGDLTENIKKRKLPILSVETKLEIINKNLDEKIPVKKLAAEYEITMNSICNWITAYKKYGESGLVDRRYKNKTN